MKKIILGSLFATSIEVAPLSEAQSIFSQNFDGQTTGNIVSGFTAVTPATATARPTGRGAVIVDESLPNRALNVYDFDTVNPVRAEQDFGPQSSAHLSLTFRRNADITIDTGAESTRAFYVTFGLNGTSQGTQANRLIEFRLFNNGVYRMNRGVQDAGGNFVSSGLTPAASFEPAGTTFGTFSLDIFVYDNTPGGGTLAYTGPDAVGRVLDPNSFSVFINNFFVTPSSSPTANGNFGLFQTTAYGTDNNVGRFAFVSGGSSAISGVDFVVDDVVLSAVPEPSTIAMTCLGGLLLIGTRRFWRR